MIERKKERKIVIQTRQIIERLTTFGHNFFRGIRCDLLRRKSLNMQDLDFVFIWHKYVTSMDHSRFYKKNPRRRIRVNWVWKHSRDREFFFQSRYWPIKLDLFVPRSSWVNIFCFQSRSRVIFQNNEKRLEEDSLFVKMSFFFHSIDLH